VIWVFTARFFERPGRGQAFGVYAWFFAACDVVSEVGGGAAGRHFSRFSCGMMVPVVWVGRGCRDEGVPLKIFNWHCVAERSRYCGI
jgi:hypothetical protein